MPSAFVFEFPYTTTGAAQSGPDRPEREAKCLRDFRIRQIRPCVQKEHLSFCLAECPECHSDERARGFRVQAGFHAIELWVHYRVDTGAGVCEKLSALSALVVTKEIGRDTEQPGLRIGASGVVSIPSDEGLCERFGG
jgi:hypothetical protein